jgi:hypothetical protein
MGHRSLPSPEEQPQAAPVEVAQFAHVHDDLPTVPDESFQGVLEEGCSAQVYLAANVEDIGLRKFFNVTFQNIHLTQSKTGRVKRGSSYGG